MFSKEALEGVLIVCSVTLFLNAILLFYFVRLYNILMVKLREEKWYRHKQEIEYLRHKNKQWAERKPVVDVNVDWWEELSWFEKKYRWIKFYTLWNFNWLFGFAKYDASNDRLDFRP
jgi:hypothetical protein